MDFIGDTKIDFMGKRKFAMVISIILALIGLYAAVSIPLGRANLGTDFEGGVTVQFRFEKPYEIEAVREGLKIAGLNEADLQEISDDSNKLLVRIKRVEKLEGMTDSISLAIATALPGNPFIIDRTTEVGPTVGEKLQKDALWAIFVALIGILIYVAWRFEFRFGVAAVIATFHDVLAVLGLIFLLDKEINLLIVTALLTLAGYSLTDTVVVFDRIRENLRKRANEEFVPLVNRSINEVLRRTIVTSGTTLLVLIALLTRGGEVIHGFAFTLVLGIIVGTYSSVFVASPLLLLWKKRGKLVKGE